MNLELQGKRVLVTGASRGLGNAIVDQFINEGARVAGCSRNPMTGEDAQLAKYHSIEGDVTDLPSAQNIVESAVEYLGGLDILICNVGSGRSVPPLQETPEDWERSIAVNLFSTTNMVTCALPFLKSSAGTIVCVSSICGVETIPGAPLTYSASKSALNSFISGASRDLALDKIRICGLAPGNMMFNGSTWDLKMKADPSKTKKIISETVPMNDFATASGMAKQVVMLASPISTFSTGSIYVVDGGQTRSW